MGLAACATSGPPGRESAPISRESAPAAASREFAEFPALYLCPTRMTNPPPADDSGRIAGYAPFAPVRGVNVALAPVDGCVSSGYGERPGGPQAFHNGVDFATGRVSRPIYAAADGTVAEARTRTGYGSQILLDHGDGVQTRYAHLSSYAGGLREGGRVRRGQLIGMTGSTGNSTAIHLHYELLVDRRSVDPFALLTGESRIASRKAGGTSGMQ